MTKDDVSEFLNALNEPAAFVNETHVGFVNAWCRLTFSEALSGVANSTRSRVAVVMPRVDAIRMAELILRVARDNQGASTIVPFTGVPPQ